MYSTTDTSLPYGQPELRANYHGKSHKKYPSLSYGEMDIIAMKHRVQRVYRNEVVNGQPLTLNNQ